MGSTIHYQIWPWVTLKAPSRSLKFGRLISHKGVQLGNMLVLNTKRKPYIWSSGTVTFDLERPRKIKVEVT